MRFIIKAETPSKKNSKKICYNPRTKKPFILSSDRFQKWHTFAVAEIERQKKLQETELISSPCKIKIQFFHSDNRKRDSDNGVGSIMDLLVDTEILKDDCWQIVNKIEVENCKENESFCIITIDKI